MNQHDDFRETSPMNTRISDPPIKITREIPLPWLLGLMGAFFVFFAGMYFQQQRQGELLENMQKQMQKLIDSQDTKNQKDQERDFDIRSLKDRMSRIELQQGAKR